MITFPLALGAFLVVTNMVWIFLKYVNHNPPGMGYPDCSNQIKMFYIGLFLFFISAIL